MIVMRSIDFALRQAEFVRLGKQSAGADDDFTRVVQTAESIGFNKLALVGGKRRVWTRETTPANGKKAKPGRKRSTGTLSEVTQVHHQWRIEGEAPIYDATFEHNADSVYQVSCYAALALATFGSFGHDLLELRLAIHEICANVVEHGLKHQSTGQIHVQLAFRGDAIEGYVQDSCDPFDPFRTERDGLPQQVKNRAQRGYGIHMIERLLNSTKYEFNETGNRITFRKKVSS